MIVVERKRTCTLSTIFNSFFTADLSANPSQAASVNGFDMAPIED